jgi:hypothetical protein
MLNLQPNQKLRLVGFGSEDLRNAQRPLFEPLATSFLENQLIKK